jgi:hypothetical protein
MATPKTAGDYFRAGLKLKDTFSLRDELAASAESDNAPDSEMAEMSPVAGMSMQTYKNYQMRANGGDKAAASAIGMSYLEVEDRNNDGQNDKEEDGDYYWKMMLDDYGRALDDQIKETQDVLDGIRTKIGENKEDAAALKEMKEARERGEQLFNEDGTFKNERWAKAVKRRAEKTGQNADMHQDPDFAKNFAESQLKAIDQENTLFNVQISETETTQNSLKMERARYGYQRTLAENQDPEAMKAVLDKAPDEAIKQLKDSPHTSPQLREHLEQLKPSTETEAQFSTFSIGDDFAKAVAEANATSPAAGLEQQKNVKAAATFG